MFHSSDPVRLLTSLGADLFAADHAHCTALHHAAENHNHLAVKNLVAAGAPLNLKNNEVQSLALVCTWLSSALSLPLSPHHTGQVSL